MKIIKILNEKFSQNNYLVVDGDNAILIDASANVAQVEESLKLFSPKPKLQAIFVTHEHFDHISEMDNLIAKYGCNVYIHKMGKNCLYKEDQNLSVLDSPFKIKSKRQVKTFEDSEEFSFGNILVKCFHTPGHSLGSSCFTIDSNMFVGDTVFKVSIGRTDLFGGDSNIQRISLLRLRNDLTESIETFYAGHSANFNLDDLKYNLNHYLGEN